MSIPTEDEGLRTVDHSLESNCGGFEDVLDRVIVGELAVDSGSVRTVFEENVAGRNLE